MRVDGIARGIRGAAALLLAAGAAFAVPMFLGGGSGPLLPGWCWGLLKTMALLTVFVDQKLQAFEISAVHRLLDLARRGLVTDLVAADRLKPDGFEDVDAVDRPADGRLPVDSLVMTS